MKNKLFLFFFSFIFLFSCVSLVSAEAYFFPTISSDYSFINPLEVPVSVSSQLDLWDYIHSADNVSTYLSFQDPVTHQGKIVFAGQSSTNSYFKVSLSNTGVIGFEAYAVLSAMPMSVTIGNNYSSEAQDTFWFKVANTNPPEYTGVTLYNVSLSNILQGEGGYFNLWASTYFTGYDRILVNYTDTNLSQLITLDRSSGDGIASSTGAIYSALNYPENSGAVLSLGGLGQNFHQKITITAYNDYGSVSRFFYANSSLVSANFSWINVGESHFSAISQASAVGGGGSGGSVGSTIIPITDLYLNNVSVPVWVTLTTSQVYNPALRISVYKSLNNGLPTSNPSNYVEIGTSSNITSSGLANFVSPLFLTAGQRYLISVNGDNAGSYKEVYYVIQNYTGSMFQWIGSFESANTPLTDGLALDVRLRNIASLGASYNSTGGSLPYQIASPSSIVMVSNTQTNRSMSNIFVNYDTITITDPVTSQNIYYSLSSGSFSSSVENDYYVMSLGRCNTILDICLTITSKSLALDTSFYITASNSFGSTTTLEPQYLTISGDTSGGGGTSGGTFSGFDWFSNLYPTASLLTSKQKMTYVSVTLLAVTLIILFAFASTTGSIPGVAIYIVMGLNVLLFFYFVAIEYISKAWLVLIALMTIALVWLFRRGA